MFVSITLNDQLQGSVQKEVIVKNSKVDVIGGLVYVTLAENIYKEEDINNFLHRQLKLQKRMEVLVDSATSSIPGLGYSFEVRGPENDDRIEEASIVLDPDVFDAEMEEELMEGEGI